MWKWWRENQLVRNGGQTISPWRNWKDRCRNDRYHNWDFEIDLAGTGGYLTKLIEPAEKLKR